MVGAKGVLAALALSPAFVSAGALAQNGYSFTDAANSAVHYDVAPAKPAMSCVSVANLATAETTIISVRIVPEADGVPEHCRVTGLIQPEIRFELNLPIKWNRRFYMHGNGGFAGEAPEFGSRPTIRANALKQGFATAQTNTGHDATAEPLASFATNYQKRVDYAFRAVHMTAVEAKRIAAAYYGRAAAYSYWDGCSTGGKEGLTEAQRYPDDYDGINIAGSANNAQIHNREQYVWNAQVTFGNAATPLGPAQTALVNSAALKACDGLDGVVDGVIDNPLTCPFKVASLLCAQNQDPSTCLTQAQVTAVEKVYQGPRNPVTGKSIYPGYSPGTELGWGSNTTGPVPSTAQNFFKFMVYNDPNWNYQTFNFSSDVAFTDAKFAVTLDAVNPDLRAFKRRGGKILQSHLWSSTTHPARRSVEWYGQVVSFMNVHDEGTRGDDRQGHLDIRDFLHEATQGDNHRYPGALNIGDFRATQHFYRFFLAPGGSGSKGPGAFDSLPYLERWVEEGIPPTSILASHVTNGVVDRTRPLCLYPAFAEYKGSGSTDDAANFKCSEPHQVPNYFLQDGLQPEPLPPSPQDQH